MSAFDKVIGYEDIKSELLKICDMIKNQEAYSKLGAKLPRGVLLEGDPGLGKTLMAKCFIKESKLPTYTLRKTKSNGDFIEKITTTFARASAKNEPTIIFFDDMDKFANEDKMHCDTEEYVAIQACIDEYKDRKIFIIATVNDEGKLPASLKRKGRFDKTIHFTTPTLKDSAEIIKYYLSTKKVSSAVNTDDIAKMFAYQSCAELESIINTAAIIAAHERKEEVEMEDLVKAILEDNYGIVNSSDECCDEDNKLKALHEAGHAVVSEILNPESVGLVSIESRIGSARGGFVHVCTEQDRRPNVVMVSLAGKAATEMYYIDRVASGCQNDLSRAYDNILDGIKDSATKGFSGIVGWDNPSQQLQYNIEQLAHAEMETFFMKTKDILIKNKDFLEKVWEELIEKKYLLASDIQRIKSETTITEVAA